MAGRFLTALAAAMAFAASVVLGAGGSAAADAGSADPLAGTAARADAPRAQLALTRSTTVGEGGLVQRYAQRVGGVPVFGAELVAVDAAASSPTLLSDSTVAGLTARDASDAISSAEAIAAARAATGVRRLRAPASAKLGIDPGADRLAWEVSLPAADPLADLLVTIDARSGERLRSRDTLMRATGAASIFNPNPVVQQGDYSGLKDKRDRDYALLSSLLVPVPLERLKVTNGCLKGLYVDARVTDRGKKVCSPGANFSGLTRSSNKFEAVMAYFHIDRTRFYADSLVLSKPLRRKPQKVFANAITDDNSFYSSMTHELVLGTGGVDDGEDADVIVHEYGHSLQDQASAGPFKARQGATIGEGFGDYMAAAMSNLTTGPSRFDTCIFDWDGVSYSPDGTCGRFANLTVDVKKAERRCRKQIHCVGQVWASTLFELRTALGTGAGGEWIMDKVVLESNFLLTRKSKFRDGGAALIAADELVYGGAHVAQIQAAMTARKFCKATC